MNLDNVTKHRIQWVLYPDTLPVRVVRFFSTVLDQILLEKGDLSSGKYTFTIGDHETGLSWGKKQEGYLGLAASPLSWATFVRDSGKRLPMASIVKIETTDRVIYRHPKYHARVGDAPKEQQQQAATSAPATGLRRILARKVIDAD